MIDLSYIRSFFPPQIAAESRFDRYMLKEYVQLMILDHITTTPYASKLAFIGGTNLRLVQGIDRFSEDLDFDCKDLSADDFRALTDSIILFLQRNGLHVEARDKASERLSAFRRNLYFPGLLFDLSLTGHRDERFLIKVEAQDQGVVYQREVVMLNKMGFFFQLQVPPVAVLCAMKLAALLSRQKGRDFYDTLFLLAKTQPDYRFLQARCGISSLPELKTAVAAMLDKVNLQQKKRDFEHLLFQPRNAERVLHFGTYFAQL